MIRMSGMNFADLPDEEFDQPMGYASGAGVIFGVAGGVMEVALRTLSEKVNGTELSDDELRNNLHASLDQ